MRIETAWAVGGIVWLIATIIAWFAGNDIIMVGDVICSQIAFATSSLIANKNNR